MQEKIYEEMSKSAGWMKFIGILSIIGGALSALSIVGIIIAWLPIWMGIVLFQAGSAASAAGLAKDEIKLVEAISKLRLYFVIMGITVIVGIAFSILATLIAMMTGFWALGGGYGGY